MSSEQVEIASSGDSQTTTAASDNLLQCYNVSCGLKYREGDNGDQVCIYHSGKPYFHDGYKEWTCCKMRSRDFTTFMSFKGCTCCVIILCPTFLNITNVHSVFSLGTKGRHNNVPPEIPKPESNGSPVEEQSPVAEAPKDVPIEAYTPPDESLIEKIKIIELASVAKAPAVKNIIICKNCKSEESSLDPEGECLYHRGVQV